MQTRDDIILIDKPTGITSFDVIRRLKPHYEKKLGHAGTLDPAASGLLILGVGKGTKKLSELTGLPKTYEAEIVLGERRDTGDREGEIIEEEVVPDIPAEKIKEVLSEMRGELILPVPKYSAVKVGGRELYKRARAGEEFTPPEKKMYVDEADLQNVEREGSGLVLEVTLSVGSGTYIRSVAEELGRRIGYPATTRSLRRTHIGDYTVEDASTIKELTSQKENPPQKKAG